MQVSEQWSCAVERQGGSRAVDTCAVMPASPAPAAEFPKVIPCEVTLGLGFRLGLVGGSGWGSDFPPFFTSERSMTPAEPAVCAVRSAVPAPAWSLPKVIPVFCTPMRSMTPAEPAVWAERPASPAPALSLPKVIPPFCPLGLGLGLIGG